MVKPDRLFVYFRPFSIQWQNSGSIKFDHIKAWMVCLELEPGTAGWQEQANSLRFAGPYYSFYFGNF